MDARKTYQWRTYGQNEDAPVVKRHEELRPEGAVMHVLSPQEQGSQKLE